VDTRVRDQVGLELCDINVQGAIESQRGRKRRNDLGNEAVEVGVSWLLNVKMTTADIVEGLVVKTKCTIGVLQKGVGGKDRVVGFDDGGRDLRTRRDGKRELGFASIVDRETF
jgi:hypothetical protein